MSLIQIKNKRGNVIFSHDCDDNDIKKTVQAAIASKVSMCGADFRGAVFHGANFSGGDFSCADFRGAYFSRVNFHGANFSGGDFSGAVFRGANFSGVKINFCIGNMREIHSMQLEKYIIVFTKYVLAIGCEQHTHEQWKNFTDKEIAQMDDDALDWWEKWKDFIFQAIELTIEEKNESK